MRCCLLKKSDGFWQMLKKCFETGRRLIPGGIDAQELLEFS
jgi:hypothetical protein